MEYLKVKNFGPLTDIDIVLKRINIFIGEQGVGKSTVAKLLTCIRNMFLQNAIIEGREDVALNMISIYGLQGMLSDTSYIEYSDDALGITIKYTEGHFSISHNMLDEDSYRKLSRGFVLKGMGLVLEKQGIDINSYKADELPGLIEKYGRTVMSNMHQALYCPAERGIVGELSKSLATLLVNEVPLPTTLLEYMSFYEKARNYFKKYTVDFLKLNFTVNDNEDCIEFDGKTVPLGMASSGIQSVLPLMMVMDYCLKEKFFLSFTIEEPELNLFPTNQMGLLRFILSRTAEDYSKLNSWTITTHSPYILSILNISLLAGSIIQKYPEAKEEVEKLLPASCVINPEEICVYALGKESEKSEESKESEKGCMNLIDSATGLISANYLDTVSDVLSSEFTRLNRLLISYVRKER